MALNTTISKAEEDEKKRAIEEKRLALLERDKSNLAAIFAGNANSIPGFVNAGGPANLQTEVGVQVDNSVNNKTSTEVKDPRFTSTTAPITQGTLGSTSYPKRVPQQAFVPDSQNVDSSIPLVLTQTGERTNSGVSEVDTEVDSVVPMQDSRSKLQSDLANLNANKNVGVAPVAVNANAEAPDFVGQALSAKPDVSAYDSDFNKAEIANGLPMGYLANTAMIESGMNPNAKNPNSTAKGLYQFIDQTASDLGLKDPFDPQQSTEAMIRLTKQNQEILRNNLGREPTGEELYIMHQQGAGNGLKVLQGDPNANAVQVLGRAEVLKNGGNENMTVQDFKNLWAAKYNRISGTTSSITAVDNPEAQERMLDGGVSEAMKNNIPETTAKALANRKFDENGFLEFDENSGYDFDGGFQHRNYETSDSGALWQGVLAGGVGMLVAALAGGSKEDIGASFAVGAATRFTDAMNQSHRYKNLDALKKQGYTAESIEAYNNNGDRSQLKKHVFGEWKEYPDGSGDLVRTLPNGKQQMKQGVAKYVPRKTIDPQTGDEYTMYFNPVKGYQKDENNNIIRDLTGKNKGESDWGDMGDGYLYNKRTGEIKHGYDKPVKDGKAVKTALQLEQEANAAQRTLGKIDETITMLEKGDGGTGPWDATRGTVYQYTGNSFFGSKNAGEVKSNIEKLQRDLIADIKHLYGPSISNSDVKQMLGFDLLDPFKDEAHNLRQLKDIRNRIDQQLRLVNEVGMDEAERRNRSQLDELKKQEPKAAYSYSNNGTVPAQGGGNWRDYGNK